MNRHPGGEAHTRKLLEKASLPKGAEILDMGAGDGGAVRLLSAQGYHAVGIDLKPRGAGVFEGNLLKTGFSDKTFDAVLSQCAFHVSGDAKGAFMESARLLKKGGRLLFSDVWFEGGEALKELLEACGYRILYLEDMTELWKAYYIEGIWNGTITPDCSVKKHCRYYAVTAERI